MAHSLVEIRFQNVTVAPLPNRTLNSSLPLQLIISHGGPRYFSTIRVEEYEADNRNIRGYIMFFFFKLHAHVKTLV